MQSHPNVSAVQDALDATDAAGGAPRTAFPTTYPALLRVTAGTATDVA